MIATPPSSPPVIVLENLVKFFGRFAALRGISASFAPGRLYVVVGDNGAGKSTLLRVVAGLMEPSQGSFTVLGTKTVREVAHRVGYMGHAPLLYDELSGMENLRYFAGLYGIHDDEAGRNCDAHGRTRSGAHAPRGAVLARHAAAACRWPAQCCTIPN